jgi:uracil-DNA glycosylase
MKESLAILKWYVDMGIDEALEETPQNRLTAPAPMPQLATISPAQPLIAQMPAAPAPIFASDALAETQALAAAANTLDELREAVCNFKGLSICRTATRPVFAQGNPDNVQVMVIGEAPGAEEDRQGVPFCGPSGQLLDKMLASIGLSRSDNAYITNTIFWRPPGNRTPTPEEQAVCRPFVDKHIALINPRLVFLVGGVAIRALLGREESLSRLRGKIYTHQNPYNNKQYNTLLSYHPSYLLRSPGQKKLAWEDLIRLKEALRKG